jgi:hypothetical protein
MSPSELLAASDHIAACEACRQQLSPGDQLKTSIGYLRENLQAEEPSHLSYDQLADYVDSNVGGVERKVIESHLEVCKPCAQEAENLRALKAEMAAYINKEYAPAEHRSIRQRLIALLQMPRYRVPLQIAATTALALIIAWAVTLPWRKQVAALRAQVNLLQQTNESLQAQASTVAELQAQIARIEQSKVDAFDSSPQIASTLYDDGRLVTIDGGGNITGLETFPQSLQQHIKATLTSKQVEVPLYFHELAAKVSTLMGTSNKGVSVALTSPIGTVIKTARPALHWRALDGATNYSISIYNSDFEKVASSPPLVGTEWTVPQPLRRGGVYSWQITATKDGKEILSPTPPAPEAKFKVLDQAKLDEIEQMKKAHPRSHLMLGVLYCQNGLVDDGEREFKALLRANPKSVIARKLANSVSELRRGKR